MHANGDLSHDATERRDVVVVGAGPIGLEVAAGLAAAGLDYVVVDGKEVGHTMTWWAPQTRWFSSNERIAIAGVPLVTPDGTKATREQYLAYLRTVVGTHDLNVRTFEPAVDVTRQGDSTFVVETAPRSGRRTIACRAVVLAVGGTDVPRRLDVPGDDLPHVDGYLREPHRYWNRRVLVIGGRNSAIEAALRIHHAGGRVTLSYRGEELPTKSIKYWLTPEITGLIKAGRINAHFGSTVHEITPTHVRLDRAGNTIDVEADDVLSLIGYEQDKRLLRRAGIDLEGDGGRPVFDDETMQTSVPGLYIAGTAVAGTQSSSYKIFLENCHDHAAKIVRHLTGASGTQRTPRLTAEPAYAAVAAAQPES